MKRENALQYVGHHVDDAFSPDPKPITKHTRLVGWQCGFEPMFVAVHSYLPGCACEFDEAEELALDLLAEIKWWGDVTPRPADYII